MGKMTLEDLIEENNLKIEDYDLYQNNSFILGDATKEISLNEGIWYNNYNSFWLKSQKREDPKNGVFNRSKPP